MNERISELAKEANANELSYAYYRGEKRPENAVTLHSVDLEKFAELIIRDCRDMFVVNSPSWNLLNEKLEHFGVEE